MAYWILKVILTPVFYVLWRVNVEGREFLIGGAPSGLTLLAQLGGSTESADVRPQGMSAEVRAR